MKIAIPLENGRLCQHFGHCKSFAIIVTNRTATRITGRSDVEPPPHEPGVLPLWLAGQGVNLVIAGGIGSRARELLLQHGIAVIAGAPEDSPESLATAYIESTLRPGNNSCDH